MSEDFLHYIWKFQLFTTLKLTLENGEKLLVVKQGTHNFDAGPDFLNAIIIIEKIQWNGSIEIHIKSSDWKKHNHQNDEKYKNVILHVVWENDEQVLRDDNTAIPTLEIKSLVQPNSLENYKNLMGNLSSIPCENFIKEINPLLVYSAKERAVITRLEQKTLILDTRLTELNNDWEQLVYERIAYCFGLKVNAENFKILSENTPVKILQKHRGSLLQIEAILFGQAGYLDKTNLEEEYYLQLQKEFRFLKSKYNLESILIEQNWNMLRLHPASFPSLRIALLAALINEKNGLFSTFLETESLDKIAKLLQTTTSNYWETHFMFGKTSKIKSVKKIAKSLFELIIINVIVPILYLYGTKKNIQVFKNKSLEFLEQTSSENNKITRIWIEIGVENKSAFDSQALIELYNNSCKSKKCLTCNIGSSILQKI